MYGFVIFSVELLSIEEFVKFAEVVELEAVVFITADEVSIDLIVRAVTRNRNSKSKYTIK